MGTDMNGVLCMWVIVTLLTAVRAELSQLTNADSCYDRAHASSLNSGLMGGYRVVSDPSNDKHVMSIVQLAMTRLNNIADNRYQFDTSANDRLVAFRQVVAGLGFCVRMRVRRVQCQSSSEVCNDSLPESLVCDADLYLRFDEQEPQDNRLQLHCE